MKTNQRLRIEISRGIQADTTITRGGFRRVFCSLFLVATVVAAVATSHRSTANAAQQTRALTFADRVAYQRAIEEVYWRHRIWPKEPDLKPALDAVMSQAQLEKKVEDYLHKSQALEDYWQRPITAEQLQAEIERMAQHTKQPEMLHELFETLGNDPFVIAECLARPTLSEGLEASFYAYDQRLQGEISEPAEADAQAEKQMPKLTATASASYTLPTIADELNGCIDTWTATSTPNAPSGRRGYTAVWTGSEMIVWGGFDSSPANTGGIYHPVTDSWTATNTTNAPDGRFDHTAVWTGSEMIVWGGAGAFPMLFNTGGRYNPVTDSWVATSTTNTPDARASHTAVWTGNEMIVWGGRQGILVVNTGGRYNPTTDTWTATNTANAPDSRVFHTAVWIGGKMIVWGGGLAMYPFSSFDTGGRYDPFTDTWTATSTTNAPDGRRGHTAIWTGSKMLIWGGSFYHNPVVQFLNTGGRYDPSSDSWVGTSTTNVPDARAGHTAVWAGSEMIVWGGGGSGPTYLLNTGGRYNPGIDSWTATSTTNAPDARAGHTAVWTGSEMIVWGGSDESDNHFNTGGRYCAQSGPTPTPRPSPTPRPRPTPRPWPTLNDSQ
jgi:N-acetylneuraminic acid mutarotase